MALKSTIAQMFARSPIRPIQKHMSKAYECVATLNDFIQAAAKTDWPQAETMQQKIVDLEHQADQLKMDVRLNLPKSIFLPVPRSDLLELLSMQEQIANRAKDIAGLMLGRKMDVPEAIKANFIEFVTQVISVCAQANKAIHELDELLEAGFKGREVSFVESLVEKLDRLENESDASEIKLRRGLFVIEKELNPIDVMFLYKVITYIGALADYAEKVGARLQVLLID